MYGIHVQTLYAKSVACLFNSVFQKTDLLAHVTLKGSKVFLKFHKFPVFPALILVNFHNSVLIFFTSVRPPLYVCVA